MEPDERHELQREVVGKASLADMTIGEIGTVLDRLNRDRPKRDSHRPHIGKIRALWWTLYWLGEVDNPGEEALAAFVRRQCGISHLRFVDHRNAPSIIEALKQWATRAGVKWPDAASTAEIAKSQPGFDQALHDRHAVLQAIETKRGELGARGASYIGYIRSVFGLSANHWAFTARQCDEGIRLLGKKLRRAIKDAG